MIKISHIVPVASQPLLRSWLSRRDSAVGCHKKDIKLIMTTLLTVFMLNQMMMMMLYLKLLIMTVNVFMLMRILCVDIDNDDDEDT